MTKSKVMQLALMASCAVVAAGWASNVSAGTPIVEPPAVANACVISKQIAEQTALKAVPAGGVVVLAVCEKDGSFHWSVDIRGKTADYEVWVNRYDKVIKIITQPL